MKNKIKAEQLGMPLGTAAARLRKTLLFEFIIRLGLNKCFQCSEWIDTEEDLSIEHKVPWLHSENPVKLFFDLDNIAFSHLRCNIRSSRKQKRLEGPEGTDWCYNCKAYLPLDRFSKSSIGNNSRSCRSCKVKEVNEWRWRTGKRKKRENK